MGEEEDPKQTGSRNTHGELGPKSVKVKASVTRRVCSFLFPCFAGRSVPPRPSTSHAASDARSRSRQPQLREWHEHSRHWASDAHDVTVRRKRPRGDGWVTKVTTGGGIFLWRGPVMLHILLYAYHDLRDFLDYQCPIWVGSI